MYKKLLCFSAALVLCLTSFIVPSFADEYFDTIEDSSTRVDITHNTSNNAYYYIKAASSNQTYPIYVFTVETNPSFYTSYVACETVPFTIQYGWSNSSPDTLTKTANNCQYSNGYYFYYDSRGNSGSSFNPNYQPVQTAYSSVDDALSSIRGYIDNTSSENYPLLYDYYIPNGNVAYIQAANPGDTITVTATFPQQSTLFSDSWSPMTMKYNWAPLSSGGVQTIHTSFPYNGQLDLPLVKTGDTNLLGQSKTGSCSFTQIDSNSLEIYNPSYRQVNASNQDQYLLNPSIHIHCDTGFIKLSVYPLKESLTPGGITATADPSNVMILQHTEDSTPEDPESEWVGADTTSSTNPPSPGGDNELPETFTIVDYINKLHGTLSNFAKSVISLLEQPIEHISDLIQAGSGFMGALRGMYAWLPVDIQGLVISALTVVIGIGVFKVFL